MSSVARHKTQAQSLHRRNSVSRPSSNSQDKLKSTLAPALDANIERMPVPQPTSSTTLPRKRCGLFMMAFLKSHPHNTTHTAPNHNINTLFRRERRRQYYCGREKIGSYEHSKWPLFQWQLHRMHYDRIATTTAHARSNQTRQASRTCRPSFSAHP